MASSHNLLTPEKRNGFLENTRRKMLAEMNNTCAAIKSRYSNDLSSEEENTDRYVNVENEGILWGSILAVAFTIFFLVFLIMYMRNGGVFSIRSLFAQFGVCLQSSRKLFWLTVFLDASLVFAVCFWLYVGLTARSIGKAYRQLSEWKTETEKEMKEKIKATEDKAAASYLKIAEDYDTRVRKYTEYYTQKGKQELQGNHSDAYAATAVVYPAIDFIMQDFEASIRKANRAANIRKLNVTCKYTVLPTEIQLDTGISFNFERYRLSGFSADQSADSIAKRSGYARAVGSLVEAMMKRVFPHDPEDQAHSAMDAPTTLIEKSFDNDSEIKLVYSAENPNFIHISQM